MNSETLSAAEKILKLDGFIAEGRTVYFQTALRTWKIDAKCVARFAEAGAKVWKAVGNSIYLANGNKFVCADGCKITVQ